MAGDTRNATLPEEVVEEILLKLPVKSLKRFRCVCRSWLSYIDSPSFIKMHHRNSHNLNALVLSIPKSVKKVQIALLCSETLSVRKKLYVPCCEIIGESQGLVLLVDDSRAGLLNPATTEFKLIPQSTVPQQDSYQYTWGFGYDSNSQDYKIVRLGIHNFVDKATELRIDLYSLSATSWRAICYPFESYPYPLQSSTYVNGRCHWWLHRGKTILAFDLAEERFYTMDFLLGGDFDPSRCFLQLRVLHNCLACSVRLNGHDECFEIWMMKDYQVKDSWTKQLVIGPIPDVEELLGMWKNGEWFFTTDFDELAMYNTQHKVVKHLRMWSGKDKYPGFQTVTFTESLYLLNGTYLNPIHKARKIIRK